MATKIIKHSNKNRKKNTITLKLGMAANAAIMAASIHSIDGFDVAKDILTDHFSRAAAPDSQTASLAPLPFQPHFKTDAELGTMRPALTATINEDNLKQSFYFDDHGNQRGSFEFAYARLKETAPEKHQWAYDIAEHARDVGVHPLPLMLIMTNEVGLNEDYTIGTKDAQGPFQTQALWFIEHVQKYAKETPFYHNHSKDDPNRIALDSILNNEELLEKEPRKTKAKNIARMFTEQDKTTNPVDWTFSELRFNKQFMAELMGVKLSHEFPEYKIDNLPQDAETALDHIITSFGKTYSEHLKGPTGSQYLYALAEAAPDLTIAMHEDVRKAADRLQSDNEWAYPFVAASWLSKTNENKGPFQNGADTRLGDVPEFFTSYVERQTNMVLEPLRPIIQVTSPIRGQTFDNYKAAILRGSKTPDVLDLLNQDTTLTASARPVARAESVTRMAQIFTSEAAGTHHRSVTSVRHTERPERKPQTNIIQASYKK